MDFKTPICHPFETEKIAAIAAQAGVAEDLEKRRRLLDPHGEKQRMWVGNKTAQLFKFTPIALRHVPYPTNVPLFERTQKPILEKGLDAVNNAVASVSQATLDAAGETYNKTMGVASAISQKTADIASSAGQATADVAGATVSGLSALGHKTANIASAAGQATADAAGATVSGLSSFGHKTANIASSVGHKTADIAASVGHATSEAVHTLGEKTASAASLLGQKTRDAAHIASDAASSVAAVVLPKAAEIAHEAKLRLVQLADDIAYSTTRSYVRALQEAERRRRMLDVDEQYAILNTLKASSVISGLGFEYYRQAGQKFPYTTTLLEESERKWRMWPTNSLLAQANARKVSLLVSGKFLPLLRSTSAPLLGAKPLQRPSHTSTYAPLLAHRAQTSVPFLAANFPTKVDPHISMAPTSYRPAL